MIPDVYPDALLWFTTGSSPPGVNQAGRPCS